MSLGYREQRQLRDIEAGLFRSDSHLAGILDAFGRLYRGPDMPASERAPPGQGRNQRAVTRIAAAVAVAALALSILFSAALTPPARSGAPAPGHRPPSPSAPGRSSCRCRDSQQSSPERRGSPSSWSFAEHPPGSPMRAKQANGARRDPQPQRYQISVRGRLGQTMCAAFPVLQARTDGDQTVLTGTLADQAALYGVLAEIEALGLELLDVRRLPPR